MTFDWEDLLTLAKQLEATALGDPVCEAKLRSAISRAYYSAFSIARMHLKERFGFEPEDRTRIHQQVWNEFKTDGDRTRRRIGYDADRLKDKRESADYDDPFDGDLASSARFSLDRAERIINTISQL